jgi:hypothetical protein
MKYNQHFQEIKDKKKHKVLKIQKDSTASMLLSVCFAFLFCTCAALGLKTIENTITHPDAMIDSLRIKSVMARTSPNRAEILSQTHDNVNLKPDTAFTFTLKFTNTGTSTWDNETFYLKSLTTALKFKHEFWPDPYFPARLKEASVAPGEVGSFVFALQAPSKIKNYTGDFTLVNNNVMVKGGKVQVVINVVEDPSKVVKEVEEDADIRMDTNNTDSEESEEEKKVQKTVCTLNLNIANASATVDNETCVAKFDIPESGPNIKVGLFYTDNAITIVNDKAWQVYDTDDKLLASVPANEEVRFIYIDSKQQYSFDRTTKTVRSDKYLKLINFNSGLFEITSHEDRPTWNTSLNYNEFTGNLLIKYNDYRDSVWVVEDLPLENYLKGMKETSNDNPTEYQKAMTVAARTYALYHVNKFHGTDSFFDVFSDERDQVYKGDVARQVMPNQEQIVDDSKGVVVTYENDVIVAYYSARSGGSTVDHKSIPYLKAKATPYTADRAMWGHAIGIDMVDAMNRASKEDWTYEDILKYYYTNVSLEKIY